MGIDKSDTKNRLDLSSGFLGLPGISLTDSFLHLVTCFASAIVANRVSKVERDLHWEDPSNDGKSSISLTEVEMTKFP
jgi:hypothetical protein